MQAFRKSHIFFSELAAIVTAYYRPRARDWAYREAHLEMARREKAGLPYISKDLIRPDKIVLPSDEELQNFEIII